jgi:hypothetical protein
MYLAVIWKKIAKPLRYLLILSLVAYLVSRGDLDPAALAKFFRLENLPCIGLLFLILAGSMLCVARRQQIILAACGATISYCVSFKVVMVGMFYNNFLPGGFGGDLVRLTYLRQGTGRSYSSLTGILLLDRVLGLVGLSACALAAGAVLVSRRVIGLEVVPTVFILVLCLPILGVAAVTFLRFPWLEERFKEWVRRSLGAAGQEFFLISPKFFRQKQALAQALLLSLANMLLAMTGIGILAAQLFSLQAFWPYALLSPGVMFIGMVPVTPGNLGWVEAVAQTVYNLCGIGGGAVVFLIWRVIACVFSLTGGLWQMFTGGVAARTGENA